MPPTEPTPAPDSVGVGYAGPATGFKGTVSGRVWFRGPACLQQNTPPVCDGPYRAIPVWFWHHDTARWVGAVWTDHSGIYRATLDPGSYTLVMSTGYGDGRWQNKVYVSANQEATADLIVDFGMR